MSSPSRSLTLSPKARQDIIDILRYTGETWGQAQLLSYRGTLNDALTLLTQRPDVGHSSQDLPASHRLYVVGSHVIIYRPRATDVAIVRILHQRMQIKGNL